MNELRRWAATADPGQIEALCQELSRTPIGERAAELIRHLRRENEILQVRLSIAGLPVRVSAPFRPLNPSGSTDVRHASMDMPRHAD